MESGDLNDMIPDCPLLIRMNDGREYFVEKPEFIIVGGYTAGALIDVDGVKRDAMLSLLNIATIIPHATRRKRRRKTA